MIRLWSLHRPIDVRFCHLNDGILLHVVQDTRQNDTNCSRQYAQPFDGILDSDCTLEERKNVEKQENSIEANIL